jgi:chromosome segregation protein
MTVWLILVLFLLCPGVTQAVEAPGSRVVSQNLGKGLAELKASVDQMSVSNEALAAKNVQLKNRLSVLQSTVQKLNQEHDELLKAKAKLDAGDPAKAKQIEQLEKRSNDLDLQGGALEDQLKTVKEALSKSQQEEEQINGRIDTLLNKSPNKSSEDLPVELSELKEQKRKEKLATLKLISEIQERRQLLQAQILDFQKGLPVEAGVSESQRRKESFEKQIAELQQEVQKLNELTNNPNQQGWNEEQIQQLESSVKELESKREELNNLVIQMQNKTRSVHLTKDQKKEEVQLQGNIEKLKAETKNLKMDLEDMQQQMVELDKRKTYLETVLKD